MQPNRGTVQQYNMCGSFCSYLCLCCRAPRVLAGCPTSRGGGSFPISGFSGYSIAPNFGSWNLGSLLSFYRSFFRARERTNSRFPPFPWIRDRLQPQQPRIPGADAPSGLNSNLLVACFCFLVAVYSVYRKLAKMAPNMRKDSGTCYRPQTERTEETHRR